MRRAPRRGGLAAGETEGAFAPEPRSQPDPERSEGARPKPRILSLIKLPGVLTQDCFWAIKSFVKGLLKGSIYRILALPNCHTRERCEGQSCPGQNK